jgi:hypothetical protein
MKPSLTNLLMLLADGIISATLDACFALFSNKLGGGLSAGKLPV